MKIYRSTGLAITLALLTTIVCAPCLHAETLTSSTQPAGTIHESLQREVNAAVDRALDWLIAQQKEDGSWSNASFPALTALPVQGLVGGKRKQDTKALNKGIDYLVSCVQDDGGIYRVVEGRKGGGLSNYNTAICMTAIHAARRPEHLRIILNAREFVAGGQHHGADIYKGGFGYDKSTKRAYTDMLNTFYSVEAIRLTQDVEDRRGAGKKRVDIAWDEALQFIERMQNRPESGDDAGGFVYNPSDPKAGATTNAAGVVVFRSYGSITYAGMLAMIYANLPATDARVMSSLDWTARHWTLDENPGMGHQGLFFFYNVLTKALSAAGRDLIPLESGELLNWREALARKLVAMQRIDPKTGHGYWINDTGRFWENDPILATSYILLALEMLE